MPVYYAPAKLNLNLHVTGKRDDGYHLLDSLVVFAQDVHDVLSVEAADEFSLSVTGPFSGDLLHGNLIEKAAIAMGELCGREPDVRIELQKNIPVGAGLGGGSSDAAATVHALEKHWDASLPEGEISSLLLGLGADVPVCYRGEAARLEGIGERLSAVPSLPAFYVLLIWPGIHAATRDVFGAVKHSGGGGSVDYPGSFDGLSGFVTFLKTTRNDLSEAAERLFPSIRAAREFLEGRDGCLLARMSGSGSAVFGIFADLSLCERACFKALETPDWWVHTSAVRS